ncbi:hypothetical protein M0802_003119 [Mischocyttarus mexicanus]|nr:hypothetical protein M0802_003119 [Mischocyttarus mexicanus]
MKLQGSPHSILQDDNDDNDNDDDTVQFTAEARRWSGRIVTGGYREDQPGYTSVLFPTRDFTADGRERSIAEEPSPAPGYELLLLQKKRIKWQIIVAASSYPFEKIEHDIPLGVS